MKYFLPFLLLGLEACTFGWSLKNEALALSIEKFEKDTQTSAREIFADPQQQQNFEDFIRENSVIDVESVDVKNPDEAAAKVMIQTFPKSFYSELKGLPAKDWKAKAAATKETKVYTVTLRKDKNWQLIEEKEIPQTPK